MTDLPKKIEYAVIGAGVIGLSIARELALAGKDVVVLEKNLQIGEETSFRNSAVLHAGIYYPSKSLKARFCRAGQDFLYQYCIEKNIPFKKTGKLIVTTHPSQQEKLNQLAVQARENGTQLEYLSGKDIAILEPKVSALEGLFIPSTGVINGRALLLNLQQDILMAGGQIFCQTPILQGEIQKDNILLRVDAGKAPIHCRYLINAAGLWAIPVAHSIQGIPKQTIPIQYLAKGSYFRLQDVTPFKRLVYPLPEQSGLGIHATTDLSGVTRFGPDVEWINQHDYTVSQQRERLFRDEIEKYYPDISGQILLPEFAGIRPKIAPAEKQPQDFVIQGYQEHGIKNLINLYGMESPGLTASMAIAHYVRQLLH